MHHENGFGNRPLPVILLENSLKLFGRHFFLFRHAIVRRLRDLEPVPHRVHLVQRVVLLALKQTKSDN